MSVQNPSYEGSVSGTSHVGDVSTLPPQIADLARQLARIHGDVRVSLESGGTHLNMASPECLELDGVDELHKKHLAVNADRYFLSGKYQNVPLSDKKRDWCARCMKTEKPYRLSDLLRMKPLADRGIQAKREGDVMVFSSSREDKLVEDDMGNLVPEQPGRVIPVTELSEDHPAVVFLRNRGFTRLQGLYDQFRLSYCVEQIAESRARRRFYKRAPWGFRDTPQHRLVFFIDMFGVCQGWQARVLERVVMDGLIKQHLHPYTGKWVNTHWKDADSGKWVMLEDENWTRDQKWNISKYKTGDGTARNAVLMGLDAARAWNARHNTSRNLAVLVEGPLDAGRFGPPAMPLLGKYLSASHEKLILQQFDKVVYFADNDEAGFKARAKIREQLMDKIDLEIIDVPKPFDDPGAIPQPLADEIMSTVTRRVL